MKLEKNKNVRNVTLNAPLGNVKTLPRRKSSAKLAWHLHICGAHRLTFSLAIIQRVKVCPQSYCSRLSQSPCWRCV